MANITVLAFGIEAGWLERLWCGLRELSACRMVVAGTVEEAKEILECVGPRVLVIQGDPDAVPDERIDELLWSNSTLAHPAAVVVAAEDYDSTRAVSLFQMGVDDYLGGSDHWGRLPEILDQLISCDSSGHHHPHLVRLTSADRRSRQLPVAPLRWVSAEPA